MFYGVLFQENATFKNHLYSRSHRFRDEAFSRRKYAPLQKKLGIIQQVFFSQISISTSGLYHQRVNTACVPFRSAAAATAALERTATSNQFKRLQLNTDYDDDIKHRMDETGQVSDTGNSVNDLTVTYPAPSTSTVCVPSKPRNSWHNPRG